MMMDLVLRLREARRLAGLSQDDAAYRSGVGPKTISSFETGDRIESMKVNQLHRLLEAYGLTEVEFFGLDLEARILESVDESPRLASFVARIEHLDEFHREKVLRALDQLLTQAEQSMSRGRRLVG